MYDIDLLTPAPTYVSIPDPTQPTMEVSPVINVDTDFGSFTFTVRAYYAGGYDTFDPAQIVTAPFTIELSNLCLESAISVTPPVSNFALYNHESLTIDLSPYFTTDADPTYCTLGYDIDIATFPTTPTYVTIPTDTDPTMELSPVINVDTDFGSFTFDVRAYYGGGIAP